MKLIFKLTILYMFALSVANAQNQAKSFLSISSGISNPIGNFAASDIENATSGFAMPGSNFSLDGAWYFHPNIGIGGVYSTSVYQLNTNELAQRYLESFDCDSALAKAAPYHTINFLVGPYFSLPLGNFTIDLRILGGITTTLSPDIIGTAINQRTGPNEGSISTFVQTSSSAIAFGFQAGLGLRYSITKHLLVSLRYDYFTSKPNLTFDNIGRTNVSGVVLTSYNQAVSGLNGTFGIGYQF